MTQISSKLQNRINDPKELENKIYTVMKGRETFYGDEIWDEIWDLVWSVSEGFLTYSYTKELKTVECTSFLGQTN